MVQQGNWLSFHLFVLGGSLSSMLNKLLLPLSERIRTYSPDCFFFIRYWENGPHFRLRIKIQDSEKGHQIREMIEAFVAELNEQTEREIVPQPIIRVEAVPYIPETQRYGGARGLQIAETHFEVSSLLTLSIAQQYELGEYSFAMSIALQAHLVFLQHSGLLRNDIHNLLQSILNGWLPYAIKALVQTGQIEAGANPQQTRINCLNYFDAAFAKNGEQTISFLQSLFTLLQNQSLDPAHPLFRWQSDNDTLLAKLSTLATENKLDGPSDSAKHNHLSILSSLMHMTNNRLGISNSDESYLAYLLIQFYTSIV